MLHTTTITVKRPDSSGAPYDATPDATTVAMGVPAHIGQESGRSVRGGTDQETVTWRLDCQVADVIHGDLVEDERTHEEFVVTWARSRQGLGLDHVEAQLLAVSQRSPV